VIRVEHREPRHEPLLDPTGDDERTTQTRLAARPRSLANLRVGLLDNGKPNASTLLTTLGDEMRRVWGVASSTVYTKGYFGTPVEPAQIQAIRNECDVVVAGIGD
jgi:hypothetical protein